MAALVTWAMVRALALAGRFTSTAAPTWATWAGPHFSHHGHFGRGLRFYPGFYGSPYYDSYYYDDYYAYSDDCGWLRRQGAAHEQPLLVAPLSRLPRLVLSWARKGRIVSGPFV